MKNDFWAWLARRQWEAVFQRDMVFLELLDKYNEAQQYHDRDPAHMQTLLEQTQQQAEQAGEHWLALFLLYRRCEAYLFTAADVRQAHDLAVRLIVQIRQPHYAECPLHAEVYRMGLDTHLFKDAVSYQAKVREMLAFVEQHTVAHADNQALLMHRRSLLEYELGNLPQALHWAREYLHYAEDSAWQSASANSWLAYLCWRAGDQQAARHHAALSAVQSRYSQRPLTLLDALGWLAVFAHEDGASKPAQDYAAAALLQAGVWNRLPGNIYIALSTYHQLRGELEAALDYEQRYLAATLHSGEQLWAARQHLRVCRLLGKLGKPLALPLAQAHVFIVALPDHAQLLAQWTHIQAGRYDEV
jgi:hypothetical protein